jgi:hypothetical protein
MQDKSAPLLELLNQRWDEFLSKAPDPTPERPFKRPVYDRNVVVRAARLHADAHRSDPFAGARITHYLKQGYVSPSEVEHDARQHA